MRAKEDENTASLYFWGIDTQVESLKLPSLGLDLTGEWFVFWWTRCLDSITSRMAYDLLEQLYPRRGLKEHHVEKHSQ